MSEVKYQLVLTGELVQDIERSRAIQGLAHLLRVPERQAERLLLGKRSLIKRPLSQEKAERMREKLIARGAECFLESMQQEQGEQAPDKVQLETTEATKAEQTESTQEDLSLDFELPEERHSPVAIEVPASVTGGPALSLEPMSPNLVEEEGDSDFGGEEIILDYRPPETPAVVITAHTDEDEKEETKSDSDSELNKGTFFEQPNVVMSSEVAKPSGGINRSVLMLGLALILAGIGWLLLPTEESEVTAPATQVASAPQPPQDPVLAKTNGNLDQLFRSVRIWMIQFGSGFNPEQVTLERLGEDLGLTADQLTDGWGHKLHFEAKNPEYSVISAGPDGLFDTADDLVRESGAVK